jgi:hypothetical protein
MADGAVVGVVDLVGRMVACLVRVPTRDVVVAIRTQRKSGRTRLGCRFP